MRKCAQLCPYNFSRLFDDIGNSSQLQMAVSAIVDSRLCMSEFLAAEVFTAAQSFISSVIYCCSLTVRSCLRLMRDLVKIDQRLYMYLIGEIFLHAAYKTTRESLSGVILDVLATTCLRFNNVRHCMNARHSLSLIHI